MNGSQEVILRHGPTDPSWLDVLLALSLVGLMVGFTVFMFVVAYDIWRNR